MKSSSRKNSKRKPQKEPKIIWEVFPYMHFDVGYSIENLTKIIECMKNDGYTSIMITNSNDCWDCETYEILASRYEKLIEAEQRYNHEMKIYEKELKKEMKNKEAKKLRLIADAKKLGLKVSED